MAAFVGSLEKLRNFIETGTDVDAKDENGRTPLLRAIKGGHIEAVRFLIGHGADVNKPDEQGYVGMRPWHPRVGHSPSRYRRASSRHGQSHPVFKGRK